MSEKGHRADIDHNFHVLLKCSDANYDECLSRMPVDSIYYVLLPLIGFIQSDSGFTPAGDVSATSCLLYTSDAADE